MRKLAATLILAVSLASSPVFESAATVRDSKASAATGVDRLTPAEAKSIIEGRAREAVRALKNRDMRRLASFVHPKKGVRFSQYGYVLPESDRVFSRSQLANLLRNNRKYFWGVYDESDTHIFLSASQYFKKFVYRQDMLKANHIDYNTPGKSGNAIPNIFESYPQAIIVAYYHPGSDPRYDGMDWEVLWMAFEKNNQAWYLVGIASEEWTI